MIRLFKNSDYSEICRWWAESGERIPPRELIAPLTYILEAPDGTPWLCLSLIELSISHIAWFENLISNPDINLPTRKTAVNRLINYVSKVAKDLGYANIVCLAPNEKLEKRYQEFGFVPTAHNYTVMIKPLTEY